MLKPKSIELLEADEAEKASKSKTAPTGTQELGSNEEERVSQAKEALKNTIKKDQARLEEVFPDTAKAAIKEHKQKEAQKALNAMSTMGSKLSPGEAHTFIKIIKEGEAEDGNDDMEKEIAKEVKKQQEANAVN